MDVTTSIRNERSELEDIKALIRRFETAVFYEAEGEYKDLSDNALKRRSAAVDQARQNLQNAIENLAARGQSK